MPHRAVNAIRGVAVGYTGAGIGVALIDSGVSSHPDLNGGFLGLSRVVWNQSFVSRQLQRQSISMDTARTSLA